MSSKPFLTVFSLLVFGYILYIILASDPLTRVNRICTPVVRWPERAVIAGVRIGWPTHEGGTRQSFDHGYQTCRRWVWGTLYQPEYERMKAQRAEEQAQHNAASAGGKTTGAKVRVNQAQSSEAGDQDSLQ